jgi:hypothetical protein
MKNIMKIVALALTLSALSLPVCGQVQVFVPGNTNGGFGNPIDMTVPFVPAITVSGPATITITYLSGTIPDGGGVDAGPNGVPWTMNGAQSPLQESRGVTHPTINNLDCLIGVFVPESTVNRPGFTAVDGTKNIAKVGIPPSSLFFVGEGKTLVVNIPGTLYLGINDWIVGDNGGGFTVEVSAQ